MAFGRLHALIVGGGRPLGHPRGSSSPRPTRAKWPDPRSPLLPPPRRVLLLRGSGRRRCAPDRRDAARAAERGRHAAPADAAAGVRRSSARGSLLTLGFGIALAEHEGIGFSPAWIQAALALWVASMALGGYGGRTARHARYLAQRLAAEGDAPSPGLDSLVSARVPLLASFASGLLLLDDPRPDGLAAELAGASARQRHVGRCLHRRRWVVAPIQTRRYDLQRDDVRRDPVFDTLARSDRRRGRPGRTCSQPVRQLQIGHRVCPVYAPPADADDHDPVTRGGPSALPSASRPACPRRERNVRHSRDRGRPPRTTPRAARKNFSFATRALALRRSTSTCDLVRGARRDATATSCAPRASSTSRPRSRTRCEPARPPIIESYGGVSLHEQSHGESFLALAHEPFRPATASTSSTSPKPRCRRTRPLVAPPRMHELVARRLASSSSQRTPDHPRPIPSARQALVRRSRSAEDREPRWDPAANARGRRQSRRRAPFSSSDRHRFMQLRTLSRCGWRPRQ